MAKIKVSEIRAKFPMYADLNDDQLLSGIRQKFYADIPPAKFASLIEYDTQREALGKELTAGMGTVERLRAGAGKAFADLGRGAAQLVGAVSREDVDDVKQRDAALMDTGAGFTGNIVGNIAAAVPTVAIPGAATLRGAAAIGGVMGGLGPVGTDDSRLGNIALGGAAGAGGVLAGRVVRGAAQAGKALIDPFTQGGREKIAGRVIQRFADDPTKVVAATGQRSITGALPTIAEETGDRGMAQLQDALRSVDPQIANMIGGRLSDNNAARVAALQGLAGDSAKRKAAEVARQTVAQPIYASAFSKEVPVDAGLKQLLERPSVKLALGRAANFAKEEGRTFGLSPDRVKPASMVLDASGAPMTPAEAVPGRIGGQTLQDIKMGLDALLKDPAAGIAGAEARAVKDTRAELLKWMEANIPEMRVARQSYAKASKPLNGMDVGEEIARRATSNTSDLAGNPRMQANALLGMLRDESGLIERATGRKGINALSDVFEPDQLNLLRTVAAEADRTAAVGSAGAGPGSATAQRMASQNVLSRLVGPTGLPESWAESAIANTVVGKPLNLIYGGVAEPKIQQALAEAVLDPAKARQFLLAAQRQGIKLPDNATTRALLQAARVSTPAAVLAQPGER